MSTPAEDSTGERTARGREQQRTLYGVPLGDRVRRVTCALGISQARLARTLGLSPAMVSQLVSARRVKIGDPAVLARLLMLDERSRALPGPPPPSIVDALLDEAAGAGWAWTGPRSPSAPAPDTRSADAAAGTAAAADADTDADTDTGSGAGPATVALRDVADPAQLAAAAAALGVAFPKLAAVLLEAAQRRPRPGSPRIGPHGERASEPSTQRPARRRPSAARECGERACE